MNKIFASLFIVFLLGISLVPSSTASAHPGVGGLRVYVINEYTGASPNWLVEVRFPLDTSDPDQDVGSFVYNLTIDGGSGWVNQGELLGEFGSTSGGGFRSLHLQGSGDIPSLNFNVTTDDGNTVVDSCIANIDVGVLDDYDTCGNMTPAFIQDYCAPRLPEETLGYVYASSVTLEHPNHNFNPPSNGQALGAFNLPGDSSSYEFRFNIEASNTVAFMQHIMFFSEVFGEAAASNSPESTNTNDITTAIPRTGAFKDGFGVAFLAEGGGGTITVRVFQNVAGSPIQLWEDDTGLIENTAHDGVFRIDPWAGLVTLDLGAYSRAARMDQTGTPPDNFHSFWLRETGGRFGARAETLHDRTGTNLCLYKASSELGGSQGSAGLPSTTQGLEDFDGEGGYGGTPSFPGLNFESQQTKFGMTESTLATLVFVVFMLGVGIGSYWYGGKELAFFGVIGTFVVGAILNLIPGWIIVFIFLIAAIVLVVGRGGSGGGEE